MSNHCMYSVRCVKCRDSADIVLTAAFLYVFGSAGSCSTDRANKKAFEKWSFIPKMLVDASDRTLEVKNRSFIQLVVI